MGPRHDANDDPLERIANALGNVCERLEKMDHGQDALLQNGQSLQGQLEALTGQITHMIEVLTSERPEQEGPSLADLLARILTQQSGMIALLREISETMKRLAAPDGVASEAHASANGAREA